jgi:hypothetical protein
MTQYFFSFWNARQSTHNRRLKRFFSTGRTLKCGEEKKRREQEG